MVQKVLGSRITHEQLRFSITIPIHLIFKKQERSREGQKMQKYVPIKYINKIISETII